MTAPAYLDTPSGRRLAYHRLPGKGPGVVFLGGFMSDMEGTKARHLETWARGCGRSFLRFDYSGHGQSSGAFADGCIGDWAQDAGAALSALTEGPQVLVGSSMGGWIALLLARALPERVVGMVGIAAAPDFTEDSMWAGFARDQRAALMADGRIEIPSGYADSPYTITRRLIEEGRENLVLRDPLRLPFPVRLLQGTADEDVEMTTALRLLAHIDCADARLTLVKGADHRFSEPADLALVEQAITEILPD
ncbi:pimeloyl-ACP methyl ester carboxylesterase [Rhodovulum bhavnagarense]|uniref:Palmitoyl-protein thioesterase ABHD10, mitochondrial n=1 Tax=Rhodovulum bhavnagarense TaxID=992286 RepID=A0A4R2RV31_9RHOB|nr:alpha/beta hydrolase [Rhodovulum bhavnagarense]TCP62985.1 pimeloyl-ACP methyl ester carboxylesterase [Rhodovulum bhavnagarense]